MSLTLFISYAMADSEALKISEIAIELEKREGIDKVNYWEGWHGYLEGDIISFMEDNIKISDIFIAVCTEASNLSVNCEKERKMAVFQNKRVMALFDDFINVPESFQYYRGVNLTGKNITEIIDEIYDLIKKGREEVIQTSTKTKNATFFSKQVDIAEIQILKAIQKEINSNLKGNFKVDEEGYVTSLDFSSVLLNSIPKSIYFFRHLITVNFSFGSFENDDEVRELLFDGKEILINGKTYIEGQIEDRVRIDSQRSQRLNAKFKVKPEQFKILEELQKLLKRELPNEDDITWSDYGVKVEIEEIVSLGLGTSELIRLPEDIGNLSSLIDLFVMFNKISTIPKSIGNLKALKRLSFKNNQLTVLPEIISDLESLRELSLGLNQFKTLPVSFGNLKELNSLWIYGNQLESLPESFGELESLEVLFIYDNNLRILPKSIGNLDSLQELDLHNNRLEVIPESFGSLKNLLKIDLSRNKIKSLPESFCNLKSLMKLDLSYNQIESLPESLGNLELLIDLNLKENYELTHLPESIGNLKSLIELNIQYGKITELPESFGNLESLQILSLIENNLTHLPDSFRNLKTLTILNLKGNKIAALPEFLLELPSLRFLNIRDNPLSSGADLIIQILRKNGVKVNK